jgi:pimeloyl-ACP methyl ester carboxylesterase
VTPGYDDPPMHATLPATPTDRSVPGDGVTLHARDWGGAAGALPVVLLHGLSSNARIWDGVATRLVVAGLRPVALDQRGHGESEQPDSGYDFATVASDLGHVLDAMGIRRPLLAGHSWGANVALQHTAAHPGEVAGLALIDGGFVDPTDWAGNDREAARLRMEPPRFAVPLEAWLDGARRWLPAGVDHAEPWARDFLRAGVEVDAEGIARARFHFDNHMQVVDALYDQRPSRLLAEVTCPLLLCPAGGQRGPAKRPAVERALRIRPDARVTWFEDSMHDIPLQHPAELAGELIRFAAEVADRG